MTPLFPSLTDVWFAQLIQRLGWTLLHSLWQGAAVASILALTLALLRHRSAQSRYLAGCLGLVLLVGLTAATYFLQPPLRKPLVAAMSGGTTATSEVMPAQAPEATSPQSIAPPPVVLPTQQFLTHTYTPSPDSLSTRLARWSIIYIEPMLPWLVGFWLIGVAVLALWQLAGWLYLRRLRRLAVPLDDPSLLQRVACLANDLQVHQTVRVFESALVGVPAVIGWLRPMIFLPLGLIGEMSPRQIDAILAHELAHIRRYDYLVNLLQCLAETLFFYHPAAWWISARIRAERENCCDDLALSLGYEPVNYAQSLLQLATLAAARCSSVRPIAGLSATGKPTQLRRRIARLLKVSEPPQRFARTWLMASVLLVVMAILGVISCGNARNGNSSQNAAESQMLHPLVQDMLASPVGSTQREVFFGALRRLAQEQGKDPLDYLTARNRMFKAGFIDGRAVELDGQDKRYVLVILSTPPSVSPGVAGQQLVLLNRDGTILDRLQCYIASKYMREVQTNVPVDSQGDGANVVVHLGPRPAGLPADSDLSKPPAWHVIVLGQDVHEFEGGIGQDRDEEQGLCRIAVAHNRFVVLFPSLAQGSWGTPDKGVALRLRSAKMQWPAEGKPTVLADFRNENQVGVLTSDVRGDWELEVDGQWYTWTGRTRQHRLSLKPSEVGGTMELLVGPGGWYAKHPALELSPGRHTLRLALNLVDAAQNTDAVGGTAPESKVLSRRVVSGPLVLEVLPPVTTQPAEPTGVQSDDPGIDLKQRQRMLLEAMAANPPDRGKVRTALTDIGHVSLGFVQGPFDQEPTGKDLPAGASVQRWERKYFLHYADGLNRLEGGLPPDQWIDRLIEIRQRGFELKFATLVAALTAQTRAERDRLLTEADARIRRGLLELSEQFKTLRNTSNGSLSDMLRHTRQGVIGLFAQKVQGNKGGSPGPVAEADRYFVLVVIEPLHFPAQGESVTQMVKFPLPEYDQLALMGQVHYSAGDPKLDAAMKKLIGEALAPLKELNRRLSNRKPVVLKVLPPATAWGKVVNGLQAGLRFGAQDRAYRSGELVEFVLVVRNTGDKAVVLADYLPLIGWPVTVRTIEGKIIPVNIPPFDGPVQGRKSIVEPGDYLEVGTVFLRIGQDGQMPSASLSPGAYLISLTYRFEDRAESTWHGELTTGDLTLNVAKPDKASVPSTQPAVSWAENAPRMNFDERNLKGVFLTEYEKASPQAVPKKQWKDFVTALGTARTRSGEGLPLEIRQDQVVLLELTDGAQIYLTGEGRYWRWEEGTNPPPPGHFLVCPALGQVVAAARAALATDWPQTQPTTQPATTTQPAPGVAAASDWSETLNGLRVRLSAPVGMAYQRKKPMPLVVEVQNNSDKPIACSSLWTTVRFLAHDAKGDWVGIPAMGPQMGEWAARTDNLAPGQITQFRTTLQSLRFNRPLKEGEEIKLQAGAPTQQLRDGKLPMEVHSPAITFRMGDPFPPLAFQESDLPKTWQLDLACELNMGLLGRQMLRLDPQGKATLIQQYQRDGKPVRGRFAVALPRKKLDELAMRLRQLESWKLGAVKGEISWPDEPFMSVVLASPTGASVVNTYARHLEDANPVVRDMRQFLEALVTEVQAQAAIAQPPIPATQPASQSATNRSTPTGGSAAADQVQAVTLGVQNRLVSGEVRIGSSGTARIAGEAGPDPSSAIVDNLQLPAEAVKRLFELAQTVLSKDAGAPQPDERKGVVRIILGTADGKSHAYTRDHGQAFALDELNEMDRIIAALKIPAQLRWAAVPTPATQPAKPAAKPAVQWENGSWSSDQPLQTRLGVQGKTFAAGGPIPMRLEVRNVGTQPILYYHATGYEYGQIQVTGPSGQALPFLAGPVSSRSSGKNLPAGTEQLVDQFDLTDHYHMRKSGQYTVHFRGFGTGHQREVDFLTFLPPSPTVQVTVTADPQSEADGDPVGNLLTGLPEGWSVWGSSKLDAKPVHPGRGWSLVPGGFKQIYHQSYSPKGLRGQPEGPKPITLWLTTEQARTEQWTGNQLDADYPQQATTRYLGGNRFYHVYAHVPDSSLKLWPAVEADLRRILRIANTTTQPGWKTTAP